MSLLVFDNNQLVFANSNAESSLIYILDIILSNALSLDNYIELLILLNNSRDVLGDLAV